MSKKVFNNSTAEVGMIELLNNFSKDALIRMMVYNGDVNNTLRHIKKEYAPSGSIYDNTKDLLSNSFDDIAPRLLFDEGLRYAKELAEINEQELNIDTAAIIAKDYARHVNHYLK